MADLLYKGDRAIGLRRRPGDIAGWPEVQRELAPTALNRDERRLYDATWRAFRQEWGLLGGSTRRAIDVHEDDEIDEQAFVTLIRAAAGLNESSSS